MSGWLGSLLGAAGQIGGAYLASQANRNAGRAQTQALQQGMTAQTDATNRGLALQADMYNQNRADLAPWRNAGSAALQTLAGQVGQGWGPGSPGYDFQFNEGMRAVNNGLAARGMTDSGAAMKAAERFGQGLAATARGEELNRLQALAGVGQTATGQGVAAGQGTANAQAGLVAGLGQSMANLYGQQGAAAANGITGAAQPWQNAANNIWALSAGRGW